MRCRLEVDSMHKMNLIQISRARVFVFLNSIKLNNIVLIYVYIYRNHVKYIGGTLGILAL
jgi:hypothetical protein